MNQHTIGYIGYLSMAAAFGILAAGCGRPSESESTEAPGVAERTGAALDRAADRTVETGRATGEAVKDVTGRGIERTGEVREDAGEALERTGEGMQKEPDATVREE